MTQKCQAGHTDTVALLIDGGAAVDSADVGEWTPLHFAAQVCIANSASISAVCYLFSSRSVLFFFFISFYFLLFLFVSLYIFLYFFCLFVCFVYFFVCLLLLELTFIGLLCDGVKMGCGNLTARL